MKISDVRLSFSSLKAFSKSPAHWVYYKKREFKQSPAMRRGWLTHLIALEPERQSELEIIDVATRANKQFKEADKKGKRKRINGNCKYEDQQRRQQ